MQKVLKILNFNARLKVLFIVFLILATAFLEIAIFLFIQPLLQFFLNIKNLSHNEKFLLLDYDFSNTLIFLFFIIIFFLRNIFYAYTSIFKNKFTKDLHISISSKIYSHYLNKNYIFFLRNNSSKLISNILNLTYQFSYNVIDSFLVFLTEIFLILAIIIFLFSKYFIFSLILLLLCFSLFFLSIFVYRKKLKIIGLKKSIADQNKINDLQKSFYAIQSIKLDGIEKFFLDKFNNSNKSSSKLLSFLNTFNDLHKPLWEILILVGFSISMYIGYNYLGLFKADLVLILGTFTIAFFRFLPSLNRLLISFNSFNFYSTSTAIIYKELSEFDNLNVEDNETIINFKFSKEIQLKNISFQYDEKSPFILDNINLIIKHNAITFIKGESGSGKSTLLNIVCGLLQPTNGEVLVDNKNVKNFIKSYQSKLGYVPQKTLLLEDTLLDNIIFGQSGKNIDLNLIKEVIHKSKLNKLIDKLPQGLNTIIGEKGSSLSGGEQQRIGIARALYKKPEILILDEATSALDETTERQILQEIFDLQEFMTIVMVSHKKIEINKEFELFELVASKIIKK
jgi:ABC-type multidrug transport system fused ATPase/permease subunit